MTKALIRDNVALAISIHTPREGSDTVMITTAGTVRISIHTPREGSDFDVVVDDNLADISIHTPREGSDAPFTLLRVSA